ncbi:MAG: HEAT repeat domain-containing protein [Acidimicrobiia bacterium]
MTDDAVPAREVVEALGTAWGIFGLYPNAEEQDAFARSLDAVRAAIDESLQLGVGPGHFTLEDEAVETEREGTERLARQCYLHQIETIRISPGLRSSDLMAFFRVLNLEEERVRAIGGVDTVLKRDGVSTLSTFQKPLLREVPPPIDRSSDVQGVIDETDAASFAQQIVVKAEEGSLADVFIGKYLDVLGQVAEDDISGREEVVRTFVEAFFHLDDPQQVEVFRELLGQRENASIGMFIDQFAGHELARMAPRLDPSALGMLMEYARVSTDQADRRPDELLALLETPEALDSARVTVTARIQERMGDVAEAVEAVGTSFDSIRDQMPETRRLFFDALETFRAMLHVEHREARFQRLVRIWTGKIGSAVRRGQYRQAELWLHAGLDNPTYPSAQESEVEMAVTTLAASDITRRLVEAAVEGDPDRPFRLLQALGPEAVNVLIDMLADEEDANRRRAMLEGLEQSANRDPSPIVARLDDAPWYLARNLAMPLGRSGHPEVAEALAGLLQHEDHRVRLEAVRSLVTLLGDDAVPYLAQAEEDDYSVVRQAAVGLLAGRDTPEARAALLAALESPTLETDEKKRIIELLARDLTPEVTQTLEQLAGQRLALSGSTRSLRAAAQKALRRQ